MKKYLEMFLSFFKIGAFTIGGGYAMLPLIEKEVVERKKWIGREEFIDMLAIAQSAPGPIAVNTAVFVGYKMSGFTGSIFTALGAVLPSYIIILAVASVFVGIQNSAIVAKVFKGIEPAVVALIAAPVIRLAKDAKINKKTIIIPVAVTGAVAFLKITPIIIILLSAAGGILFMHYSRRRAQ